MPAAFRIGVLGAAAIARGFIAGAAPSTTAKVTAVAARDPARAKAFAAETGLSRSLPTYEALLADPDIEGVYVPLPNGLHAEWTIKALEAGKHVLCEKPLAASGAEARAMYAAARKAGRLLVEGYPYRLQPQTQELMRLVRCGEIGKPRIIQASVGFTLTDDSDIRLDPALAGGALMDAGTYPLSFVRMLASGPAQAVDVRARWSGSGVDTSLIANLDFPDGLLAQVSCTFSAAAHRQAVVALTGGVVLTTYLNHTGGHLAPVLQVRRGTASSIPFETVELPAVNGFLAEVEAFARAAQGQGDWLGISEQESIDVADMLEMISRARPAPRG